MTDVAEQLVRIRRDRGFTRGELEVKSGVSSGTIQKIEQGRQDPRGETLKKLAAALSVSTDELLGVTPITRASGKAKAKPERRRFRGRQPKNLPTRRRSSGNGYYPQTRGDQRRPA